MCDIKWGVTSISCARSNAEVDLLIKHADKVLHIFHATILYLQQVNANLLHNSSLLSVNSWRFIGLHQGVFCDMFNVHFYLSRRIFKDYWIVVVPCMWNVETKLILVVIWATGTISKSSRKYPSNVPRKHDIKKLQKTVILGTAHIFWKVLM